MKTFLTVCCLVLSAPLAFGDPATLANYIDCYEAVRNLNPQFPDHDPELRQSGLIRFTSQADGLIVLPQRKWDPAYTERFYEIHGFYVFSKKGGARFFPHPSYHSPLAEVYFRVEIPGYDEPFTGVRAWSCRDREARERRHVVASCIRDAKKCAEVDQQMREQNEGQECVDGDYPSVYVTYDPALGVGPILSDSGVDEWTNKDMDEDEDLGLARMYFAEALMPELKYRFEERYAAFLKCGVNATSQAEGADAQYAEFVTALDRCDVVAEDSALRDSRRNELHNELQALRAMVVKTKA